VKLCRRRKRRRNPRFRIGQGRLTTNQSVAYIDDNSSLRGPPTAVPGIHGFNAVAYEPDEPLLTVALMADRLHVEILTGG
jgi:hypothetical protein